MKNLKMNFAMLAMVLGITAAVGFKGTAKSVTAKPGTTWFSYNGAGSTNPLNYTKVSARPEDCNGTAALCAIQGDENGSTGHPTQGTVNAPTATAKFQ
jgi:hypothetical protein